MMIQSECVTIHMSEEEADGLRLEIMTLVASKVVTRHFAYLLKLMNALPKRIES